MQLFNTLTRKKDELVPLKENSVSIYTCGLTVYSHPHIGNWVGYIYWDILVRTLQCSGYTVTRVQNITDVGHLVSDDDSGEDKMEKGARAEGVTAWDIAKKYSAIAAEEASKLGLLQPTILAKATDYIAEQIAFVEELQTLGYTYVIENEGIYFDTSKLKEYGKLARLDVEGLQAGARVAVDGKKNPTDFALWKFSPKGKKRDMEWESPWGIGFPGWHLECSAIARKTLGDSIDIHTGGIDHIPVHHTNEIAQTESLTGKQFAQIWLHNNHLKVNNQKMSKSLGNIITLKDIEDKQYDILSFKVMVLAKHYTTEGNFTWENLTAAAHRLDKWKRAAVLRYQSQQLNKTIQSIESIDFAAIQDEILASLHDDLNTPRALELLENALDMVRTKGLNDTSLQAYNTFLSFTVNCLGIDLVATPDIDEPTKLSLEAILAARANKDYQTADTIREELREKAIGIELSADAVVWYWL